MSRVKKLYLILRAIPKTVYFNFRYFHPRVAMRLPVWVSHRVVLLKTQGTVRLEGAIWPAKIRIGFGEVGIFDANCSRSIWELTGEVIFKGKAHIGHGAKLSVAGQLTLGDEFTITAESTIVCDKEIRIGDSCLLSWDVLIMDTDHHDLCDRGGRVINPDKAVIIGDNVWIGCRSLLLKGSVVPSHSVVGANTFLNKPMVGERILIAGNPARKIREDICREP